MAKEDGSTKYGLIELHWTTSTTSYDMDNRLKISIEKKNTEKRKTITSAASNLPTLLMSSERLNNTPVAGFLARNNLNTDMKLPKIIASDNKICLTKIKFPLCTPVPPTNSAEANIF